MRLCCARPALTVFVALSSSPRSASATRRIPSRSRRPSSTCSRSTSRTPRSTRTTPRTSASSRTSSSSCKARPSRPPRPTRPAWPASSATGALGTARVSYRIDASRLEAHALLYLPLDTLRDTLDTVASHEDLLADFAATPTLDRLVDGINQYVGATFLPGVFGPGAADETNPAPTRLLRDLLTQMSERIDGRPYRSPWASLVRRSRPPPRDGGYFLSHDRRLLYVVIDLADAPRTFAAEHAAILAVRRAIASLRPEFPSVEAGVTGAPALFSDELSAADPRRRDRQCPGPGPHPRAVVARVPAPRDLVRDARRARAEPAAGRWASSRCSSATSRSSP